MQVFIVKAGDIRADLDIVLLCTYYVNKELLIGVAPSPFVDLRTSSTKLKIGRMSSKIKAKLSQLAQGKSTPFNNAQLLNFTLLFWVSPHLHLLNYSTRFLGDLKLYSHSLLDCSLIGLMLESLEHSCYRRPKLSQAEVIQEFPS